MKKIKAEILPVASIGEDEAKTFAEWVWKMRHLNMFDMNVIGYPRTAMLKASDEEKALLYMPIQSVLMFDSIAPRPGLTPRQEALCLARIRDLVDDVAKSSRHRETYFFCKDDRVADISIKHGYEEIKGVRLLRRKV
jgi:hypothetical protein